MKNIYSRKSSKTWYELQKSTLFQTNLAPFLQPTNSIRQKLHFGLCSQEHRILPSQPLVKGQPSQDGWATAILIFLQLPVAEAKFCPLRLRVVLPSSAQPLLGGYKLYLGNSTAGD